jgi:hypothetical protein
MPTGYTQDLYDGKDITFRDFALKCARAMGAAIRQRDDAPNVEIQMRKVEESYYSRVDSAATELAKALTKSATEWETEQNKEIEEALEYKGDYSQKQMNLGKRYKAMLATVQHWEPPTSEHEGLKRFMIEQLESSIDFDILDYVPSVPERLSVSDYSTNKIQAIAKRFDNAVESLRKQESLAKSQNEWVTTLRDSL